MTTYCDCVKNDCSGFHAGWPKSWPRYHNASDWCDTRQGHCACGAYHEAGEFEFKDGVLYRYGKAVSDPRGLSPGTPVVRRSRDKRGYFAEYVVTESQMRDKKSEWYDSDDQVQRAAALAAEQIARHLRNHCKDLRKGFKIRLELTQDLVSNF